MSQDAIDSGVSRSTCVETGRNRQVTLVCHSHICTCMQVQVRHDDTIHGSDRLTEMVTATIESVLDRFVENITTVEVHFADENGKKTGGDDIRCSIEVRFEGRKPVAVNHHASDLEVALGVAAEKMARMLDHQLGRIRDQLPADV